MLRRLPRDRFHACVKSPPCHFVCCNGHAEQIGLEESPVAYVDALVRVSRQVRRVLHPLGTLWIVIGDTHCTRRAIRSDGKRTVARDTAPGKNTPGRWSDAAVEGRVLYSSRMSKHGLKEKDLMLLPARLALALQADGWWVCSAIAWVKPNFAPSPADNRPVHGYEAALLLGKSKRYWYDAAGARCVDRAAESREGRPHLRLPRWTGGQVRARGLAAGLPGARPLRRDGDDRDGGRAARQDRRAGRVGPRPRQDDPEALGRTAHRGGANEIGRPMRRRCVRMIAARSGIPAT